MLLVLFKVLLESVLNIFCLSNLLVNDVEYIFQNEIYLSHWGLLDEVFDDFYLKLAHIDLAETIRIISF